MKKQFASKRYAHLSIQFTMDKNGVVDMKLTTNVSPKPFKRFHDAGIHGYYLSVSELLEESDHGFLQEFCISYLRNRKIDQSPYPLNDRK